MNAHIKRYASGGIGFSSSWNYSPPRCAIVIINGEPWSSPVPETSGDAETFNQVAQWIVEAASSPKPNK